MRVRFGLAVWILAAGVAFHARADSADTATPIKHLIVIIGENRSFDHLFGLYVPRAGQTVSNILSKGLVTADGAPGPHFADAAQYRAEPEGAYFVSPKAKTPYATLPPPDLNGTPAVGTDKNPVRIGGPMGFDEATGFASVEAARKVERDLKLSQIHLMTTGATGLATTEGVDTRVPHAENLPNGPFPLRGPALPYDSYTGDTVHRLFQMWQQSDCNVGQASPANPSGCLNDLYPWVATTQGKKNYGGGSALGFYDVGRGDAPYLKRLADTYALADNYHQAAMGGTMIEHLLLADGDLPFVSDGHGHPVMPPAGLADPTPKPGTENQYAQDGVFALCGDKSAPGVGAVLGYLASLPHPVAGGCEPGRAYTINNLSPGFEPDGKIATGRALPPSDLRTVGDALDAKNISYAYYGGGYGAALRHAKNTYCDICNPFEYATSIMADARKRAAHLKDVQDLMRDIGAGALPAVALVKPDGWLDGHPQTSKVDLFEAFAKNIVDKVVADRGLFASTAIIVTFDEAGGYWDSGYIQPLDFFGDGPRIPTIAISPYSKGGRVVHTYFDHVSVLKFIERNWSLAPLSARSRDRLPNPAMDAKNPYVPTNGPAIGDLFDMFDFKGAR